MNTQPSSSSTTTSSSPTSDTPPDTSPPAANAGAEEGFGQVRRPLERSCLWCGQHFALHRGPGRQRVYCRTSCRQRAYERRRGLGVLPPPERLITRPDGPLAHLPGRYLTYEAAGSSAIPGRKLHALRPAGVAEPGERRVTLCGVMRAPNGLPFVPSTHERTCQTCSAVAKARPPQRPMRPSSDLAAYRALLDEVGVRLVTTAATEPDPQATKAALLDLLLAAA